uniref:F-box associated domain-containing protein n=1 Tax=Oryza glumipatula TaxID=40148 RepID=A0A0D9YS68_9ORYZ
MAVRPSTERTAVAVAPPAHVAEAEVKAAARRCHAAWCRRKPAAATTSPPTHAGTAPPHHPPFPRLTATNASASAAVYLGRPSAPFKNNIAASIEQERHGAEVARIPPACSPSCPMRPGTRRCCSPTQSRASSPRFISPQPRAFPPPSASPSARPPSSPSWPGMTPCPLLPSRTSPPTRSSLVLVSAVQKSHLSVRLWTLRGGGGGGHGGGAGSGGAWTEVVRMPPEVHAQFAAAEGGRGFECVAHGDYVVLAPRGPVAQAPTSALVFDSRRDEWRWAALARVSGCSRTSPAWRRQPLASSTPRWSTAWME